MSNKPIKLELDAYLDSVTGRGEDLIYTIRGTRELRSGRYEHYEVRIKACRYSVIQIQREVRKMHARDRQRLADEQARIEREIRAVSEDV